MKCDDIDRDTAFCLAVPVFGMDNFDLDVTEWGYIAEKENTERPSIPLIECVFGPVPNELKDESFVLHERILMMEPGTMLPIRSHEEEYAEIAVPLGGQVYILAEDKSVSAPVRLLISKSPTIMVDFPEDGKQRGFYHGLTTIEGGALYIGKLLKPGFVDGKSSFIMPENTYKQST